MCSLCDRQSHEQVQEIPHKNWQKSSFCYELRGKFTWCINYSILPSIRWSQKKKNLNSIFIYSSNKHFIGNTGINYDRWLKKEWYGNSFLIASNFCSVPKFMYMKFCANQSEIVDLYKVHTYTHIFTYIY